MSCWRWRCCFCFLQGPSGGKSDADAAPTPEVTAAPSASAGLTIAGVDVDPAADSFELAGKTLSAGDCASIASLGNLTTLSLTNCNISDVHFLAGLTQLRTLILSDNAMADASPLASLSQLRTLYLDRNPVADLSVLSPLFCAHDALHSGRGDRGLCARRPAKALPGCRIFSDSVVKGSRPVSLGGLDFTESVESLDLSGRGITDISALSGCSELRELNLSNNPIADISTLALLPKLTSLDLSATGRSDLDNELLSSLRSLSYLKLENNDGVTAEGIDALQSALPSCQIVHEPKYYTVVFGDQSFSSDASDVTVDALGLTTLSGIEKFHQLRRLSAYGNTLTDLAPLAELFSVEELQLGYNNLCDLSAHRPHGAAATHSRPQRPARHHRALRLHRARGARSQL